MFTRKGSAVWQGSLKEGSGTVASSSGALRDTPYSFGRRFGDDPGTNPEELIAAAHAGCFSMALSAQLGNLGLTPERIETTAAATLDKVGDGFEVTKIHLDVRARVPGASPEQFERAAQNAKEGCPISRLLRAAEITMDARLEQTAGV